MRKVITKTVTLCLCLLCSLCMLPETTSVSADATEDNGISVYWVNLNKCNFFLSYSSGEVNWQGQLRGNANTANITATFTLEKWNSATSSYGTVVTSPTISANSMTLSYSNSTTTSKGTYRLSVTATITNTSGVSENISNSLVKTFI